MQIQSPATDAYAMGDGRSLDANQSGVSWSAVLAGAAAAAALSLILLILGVGLGLSVVSPWSHSVNHGTAIGVSTIAWLAFMAIASSGVGGYLAGRLRVKWTGVHTDEVYFRDTAHGMLSWAVASLIAAALLTGAVRTVLSGAVDAGTGVATAVAPAASSISSSSSNNGSDGASNPVDYFSDMLLRSDQETPDANRAALRGEVSKIFLTDLRNNKLAPDDRSYLARMVAKRTGMNQTDAERRVDDVFSQASAAGNNAKAAAKQAADAARKAAAHSALWMFVALLLGAFVASLAATLGGRQRDGAHFSG